MYVWHLGFKMDEAILILLKKSTHQGQHFDVLLIKLAKSEISYQKSDDDSSQILGIFDYVNWTNHHIQCVKRLSHLQMNYQKLEVVS